MRYLDLIWFHFSSTAISVDRTWNQTSSQLYTHQNGMRLVSLTWSITLILNNYDSAHVRDSDMQCPYSMPSVCLLDHLTSLYAQGTHSPVYGLVSSMAHCEGPSRKVSFSPVDWDRDQASRHSYIHTKTQVEWDIWTWPDFNYPQLLRKCPHQRLWIGLLP